jgi:hypothetical protein
MPDLVLIHSPLVGVSSWLPTAVALRSRGASVHVPDIVSAAAAFPAWRDWSSRLLPQIGGLQRPILIGHSAACVLIAEISGKMATSGLIFVDGQIPPGEGDVAAAEGWFRTFVDKLPVSDGRLPPWSDWWGPEAMTALFTDPVARESFAGGLPRLRRDWFDDSIVLKSWSHVPAGYIRTSELLEADAASAGQRGWPVIRLQGTHLHPLLRPEETADAILSIVCRLG